MQELADRTTSYGQRRPPTVVDRFGVWLSTRAIRRSVESFRGKSVGDLGCGYHATFMRSVLDEVDRAVLVDVAIAPDLKADDRVTAIEAPLPDAVTALDDGVLDVVLCVSVLEHLLEPLELLRECPRMLAPGGVGGSAAHASHAVNDFRKLCAFEAYAPTDTVSELTARVNDDGWESAYAAWLRGSRLEERDAVLALSVGGGSIEKNLSSNLVAALDLARQVGASVFAIVGRDGGYARKTSDACIIIPPLVPDRVTPHTECLASVVCHLLVSHPALQVSAPTWEARG